MLRSHSSEIGVSSSAGCSDRTYLATRVMSHKTGIGTSSAPSTISLSAASLISVVVIVKLLSKLLFPAERAELDSVIVRVAVKNHAEHHVAVRAGDLRQFVAHSFPPSASSK